MMPHQSTLAVAFLALIDPPSSGQSGASCFEDFSCVVTTEETRATLGGESKIRRPKISGSSGIVTRLANPATRSSHQDHTLRIPSRFGFEAVEVDA